MRGGELLESGVHKVRQGIASHHALNVNIHTISRVQHAIYSVWVLPIHPLLKHPPKHHHIS